MGAPRRIARGARSANVQDMGCGNAVPCNLQLSYNLKLEEI